MEINKLYIPKIGKCQWNISRRKAKILSRVSLRALLSNTTAKGQMKSSSHGTCWPQLKLSCFLFGRRHWRRMRNVTASCFVCIAASNYFLHPRTKMSARFVCIGERTLGQTSPLASPRIFSCLPVVCPAYVKRCSSFFVVSMFETKNKKSPFEWRREKKKQGK